MEQIDNVLKLLRLISGAEKAELNEGSTALSCPNCKKTILQAFIKDNKIQYKYDQLLAEDGEGIQPSDNTTIADGLMYLDGELLTGYCRSCNTTYYLFDMWLSQDKIFAYDGTTAWHLPEEFELTKKCPIQMIYEVTIGGVQIGILEEFKNMPWKTSQGVLYLFESRLFQKGSNNEDENILSTRSFFNDVQELCTNTFTIIREVLNPD